MDEELKTKKKMRSPNFPALPIEKCIEISKLLFEKYRLSAVAYEVAVKGLNYSPKSSSGLQLLGALTAYGLIEVIGAGKEKRIKLSQLAYRIIEDKRTISPERADAIREAALNPSFFRKLKEDFPDNLPPIDALGHDLKFKYEFNPNTVQSFINVFTQTANYAKIYESDIIGEETNTEEDSPMIAVTDKDTIKDKAFRGASLPPVLTGMEREIANYPVGRGLKARIIISGDATITAEAIDKLIKLLELNKDDLPEKNQNEASDSSN